MTVFFYRLALAYLAEWFCYRIATPAMRFRWAKERVERNIARSMQDASSVMVQFTANVYGVIESFTELRTQFEEWDRRST